MSWGKETNIKGQPGPQGVKGDTGPPGAASTVPGPQGPTGPGVAPGGTTGQVLTKIDATNYNTNWKTIVGGALISDTAPSSPQVGQMWFESDTGNTFIWYNDGNSSQWVQVNASITSSGNFVSKSGDTMTGNLTVPSLIAAAWVVSNGGAFSGSASQAVLGGASGSTAPVRLRPNGYDSATNEAVLTNAGAFSAVTVTGTSALYSGTFSATGTSLGTASSSGRTNSSVNATTSGVHYSFYNPNGQVGTIATTASATAFNTSSDERLKDFIGPYDPDAAIAIIRADPVRAFTWKVDGAPAVGWGAQTSYAISPDLASPPPDELMDRHPGDEDFMPWGIDQGKRTPYLWAALSRALDRIDELEARLSALEVAS